MRYEILDAPDFGMLKVNLEQGDHLVAESGAMVAMSSGVRMDTAARTGVTDAGKCPAYVDGQRAGRSGDQCGASQL